MKSHRFGLTWINDRSVFGWTLLLNLSTNDKQYDSRLHVDWHNIRFLGFLNLYLKVESHLLQLDFCLCNWLVSHNVIDDAWDSDEGQEVIVQHRNRYQDIKMLLFYVVYYCLNRLNYQCWTAFIEFQKFLLHKRRKVHQNWLKNRRKGGRW